VVESDEDESTEEKNDKDHEFKLVGVVCHMGIADAGHYISYINVERDSETQKVPREEWINIEK
jgi:ubiquitin C-terminal hydrolase